MESCSVETQSLGSSSSSVQLGRVKWFNNKAGFGFITVTTEGPFKGTDVFAHHSGISVLNEQYKYLVQGEYVEFHLEKTDGVKHKYQAGKVSGLNGGNLMCETRREFRQTRAIFQETKQELVETLKEVLPVETQVLTQQPKKRTYNKQPKQQSNDAIDNGGEWGTVQKNSTIRKNKKSNSQVKL